MSEQANLQEEIQLAATQLEATPLDATVARTGGDVAEATDSQTPGAAAPSAITEARRYRKRAQAAEKSLDEVKTSLAEREKTITQQQQTINELQRRRLIDQALIEADSIDLETTRVLIEASISTIDRPKDSDIAHAVQEIRRRKPFLFRSEKRRGTLSAGALSAANGVETTPDVTSLERAAADAVNTGKRTDLLRYLRLRRKH